MLGSPNAVPFVYDGRFAPEGSIEISDFLVAELEASGSEPALIDVGGASDHGSFADAGIPVGGLFTGASGIKSPEQAAAYGGRANQPMDACYHLACDAAANVDTDQAAAFAKVALAAAIALAQGDLLP
jgi:aminopeptidase S